MLVIKNKAEHIAVNQLFKLIGEEPNRNMRRILEWVSKTDYNGLHHKIYKTIDKIIDNPQSNWNLYLKRLFDEINPLALEKFVENFIINGGIYGYQKLGKNRKAYDCNIPFAILMEPTTACNLSCTGCQTESVRQETTMSYETMDSIVSQGKALGTYFYLFTGGEPMLCSKEIFKLAENHPDCEFMIFTNGSGMNDLTALRLKTLGNIIMAVGLEGYEMDTDSRRGKGAFQTALAAMAVLKTFRVPFGTSICVTRDNAGIVASEEYMDFLIDKGSIINWFFNYMPVGSNAPAKLMATPHQREYLCRQIRKMRETKPIFNIDFTHDAEYVGGCIGGGRQYLFINADGAVTPCAFVPYSGANLKEVSLLEALNQPLFQEYRRHQPFNENMFRACPVMDNPHMIAKMVQKANARTIDAVSCENVDKLCVKLKDYADRWAAHSEEFWEENIDEQCIRCKSYGSYGGRRFVSFQDK